MLVNTTQWMLRTCIDTTDKLRLMRKTYNGAARRNNLTSYALLLPIFNENGDTRDAILCKRSENNTARIHNQIHFVIKVPSEWLCLEQKKIDISTIKRKSEWAMASPSPPQDQRFQISHTLTHTRNATRGAKNYINLSVFISFHFLRSLRLLCAQ